MSVTDRQFNSRTYDTKSFYPLTVLSLNEIFRESMRKVQTLFNTLGVVARSEHLPNIKGNRDGIMQVFEDLLAIIFSNADPAMQLLLYVDCEEAKDDARAIGDESKKYTLKFRTNIPANKNWQEQNLAVLENCRQILSHHNATLLLNHGNGACLFSIMLQGKF